MLANDTIAEGFSSAAPQDSESVAFAAKLLRESLVM